jgi:hypothetical protein
MNSATEHLETIAETALFYPCSGNDLEVPVKLFASVIADFYFVDLNRPEHPDLSGFARLLRRAQPNKYCIRDVFIHDASNHEFRVHRCQSCAKEFLNRLPELGVFFFRGDYPVEGEGSSGVLWLGGRLFSQILTHLIPGGLVVTDGSNPGCGGPAQLSRFYDNDDIRKDAVARSEPFEHGGRRFTCIAYVGQKNGPTLIWRVD